MEGLQANVKEWIRVESQLCDHLQLLANKRNKLTYLRPGRSLLLAHVELEACISSVMQMTAEINNVLMGISAHREMYDSSWPIEEHVIERMTDSLRNQTLLEVTIARELSEKVLTWPGPSQDEMMAMLASCTFKPYIRGGIHEAFSQLKPT